MIKLKQVIRDTKTNSIEATWVDDDDKQVKCHSYADVQMQMFRDDLAMLGGYGAEIEALITTVEAGIVPYAPPVPTPEQLIAELEAQFTQRRLREVLLTGDKTFLQTLGAQIVIERAKIKPKTT